MSYEQAREKMVKNNAVVRKLVEAGFVYCEGRIFTGDAFNLETCTWAPGHWPVADLIWKGGEWVVVPRAGHEDLFRGGEFDAG